MDPIQLCKNLNDAAHSLATMTAKPEVGMASYAMGLNTVVRRIAVLWYGEDAVRMMEAAARK